MPRHIFSRLYRKLLAWRFSRFEKRINSATVATHDSVIIWAEEIARKRKSSVEGSGEHLDEVVQTGRLLRQAALAKFKNQYSALAQLRILIHLPDRNVSPAGNFLFENLRQSLDFLGIATAILDWDDRELHILESFKPTIFLTSDHQTYLERINWNRLDAYRLKHSLKLGLTASLEEYGNTGLTGRLKQARDRRVDFYYSFRTAEYLQQRREYFPFFDSGYDILSVEFGANILHYYPEPAIEPDLDFVFFGSVNPDKAARYVKYFAKIFQNFPGYIDGVGWAELQTTAEQKIQRYIYARARVGINLHLDEQIRWPNELNERTYVLAACGVPQVIDNPALLAAQFSPDAFFVAHNRKEYFRLFREALNNPEERTRRSLIALNEVYSRHTTLHRASRFAEALAKQVQKIAKD